MKVGLYELSNEEKLERALNGTLTRGGVLTGGVGKFVFKAPLSADGKALSGKELAEAEVRAKENYERLLLAEYDRLGGLITKDGIKVVTGSFWDVLLKAPRPEPKLSFVTVLEGELLEGSEDEVKAIESSKERLKTLKGKKKKK